MCLFARDPMVHKAEVETMQWPKISIMSSCPSKILIFKLMSYRTLFPEHLLWALKAGSGDTK